MNAPDPIEAATLDRLRARLERLAKDPRVRLVPEGLAIAGELRDAVALINRLELRVAALERRLGIEILIDGGSACDS